ncbi:MFS general substrate transporter [Pleomassaria siparia CBS 279.74]|uniref:MFS general substrate transporter n=1 Tax=Pleomassaria siparia CBS 279.74 TaxID=1314801 RepID=A0A6G1KRT5_9PLEO|nr:MFS general substrate transporter [Pleomassaria siparia CBS 279.74]
MAGENPNTSNGSQIEITQTSSCTLSCAEFRDLRRVPDDLPKRLWAVAVIAFWERFTFWGLTAPWQNFMQNPPRGAVPGVLNLGQAKATRIYCAFYIFYYMTPIFFAILSDTRLGRYTTLNISASLYTIGCAMIIGASHRSPTGSRYALPGFLISLVFIGLGGGGLHVVLPPFIADQYTETKSKVKTLKSGERVVIDRSETITYIYGLYYWVGNLGSLSWFATTFLERHYGFHAAFLLTLCSSIIFSLMLFLGKEWYIKVPHEGNILPKAAKILVCASRNGFRMAHTDPAYQLEHRGKTVSWSNELVAELCRGMKACRVLIAFVAFWICFDQMQTNLISQAATMEPYGIPNDAIPAINQVACIIFGPLIQSVLYPFLYRRKIRFQPIAKMTVGFGFVTLSMLYATMVQQHIYTSGPCYKYPRECPDAWLSMDSATENASMGNSTATKLQLSKESSSMMVQRPNHVNIWVQTPIYIFIAIGEIFALVAGLEYAYELAPQHMKVIVQAISLLVAGVGTGLSLALTAMAHDPHLVIFYASIAGTMAVTTVGFWLLFRTYDKHAPDEEGVTEVVFDKDLRDDLANAVARDTSIVCSVSETKPEEDETRSKLTTAHLGDGSKLGSPKDSRDTRTRKSIEVDREILGANTSGNTATITSAVDESIHPDIRVDNTSMHPAHPLTSATFSSGSTQEYLQGETAPALDFPLKD